MLTQPSCCLPRGAQVDAAWVFNERKRDEIRTAEQWEWCPGEPNNAGGNEDSAIINRLCTGQTYGGLNDVPGTMRFPAMCSKTNMCTRKDAVHPMLTSGLVGSSLSAGSSCRAGGPEEPLPLECRS